MINKLKNSFLIFAFLTLSINFSYSQKSNDEVIWYSINEAQALAKENPKTILIDIYTDWCTWCKVMDKKTWTNPVIAKYINDNFYAVKFNAETLDTVVFQDHTFINENMTRSSVHQFAIGILQGKMSYPSIAYLDKNLQLVTAIAGYQKPEDIEPILVFIHEEKYKTTTYEEFIKKFKTKL